MNDFENVQKMKEKLTDIGIPNDLADALAEKLTISHNPTVKAHAKGGRGGKAINLTYVDNYSTLMLVYTFLLNSLDDEHQNQVLNKSLLETFQVLIEEQQQYRNAFIAAVNKLTQDDE